MNLTKLMDKLEFKLLCLQHKMWNDFHFLWLVIKMDMGDIIFRKMVKEKQKEEKE